MKLKVRPEDFRVEEKLRLRLKRAGPYSIYRLEKRLWNTLDVVSHLEHRHGLRRIGRAGLKDRYALSVQFLSIPGRGPKAITEKNYSLRLAGMADKPVSRDLLLGNSFSILLRDVAADEASSVTKALPQVERFGFPNYYDEQRMGSARHGQGFIARRLVDGHLSGALKLYLGTPSSADDARTRRTKTLIEESWGDWRKCLALVSPEAWPVMKYLVFHTRDFSGAVRLIPRELLGLFVNAYQAWLWNEVMVAVLEDIRLPVRYVDYRLGRFAFYDGLTSEQQRYLARLVIPAPAPDAAFASDRVARITAEVLKREGLELNRLKLKVRVEGVFFKGYERSVLAVPQRLEWSQPEPDDLYPGRQKLALSFFLTAGSFATILVKRLSLG
jgi:tRNA pseudouridine13 synthase